jgi:hypothetical protein
MKTAAWVAVAYLGVVGAATFASGVMADSPTMDSIAHLPSVGSFLGSSGTTAAALDLGGATAIWFFFLR